MATARNAPQEKLLLEMETDIMRGEIVVIDAEPTFNMINDSFPFIGSAINWQKVSGSVEEEAPTEEDYSASVHSFLENFLSQIGLKNEDTVSVVGDSAMECGLSLTVKALRKHLDEILWMPQHTYVVSPGDLWCLCFRMEGYMGFGAKP